MSQAPSLLSGFRDMLPNLYAQRQHVVDVITATYKQFGYQGMETPALEKEEVFSGQYGEEGEKLRYRFTDGGERQVGMRYDLTVPFARFLATNVPSGEVPLPFRRFQIGSVWRADRPQKGRFREFMQCDFDVAGLTGSLADAEVLAVVGSAVAALKLPITIHVADRELHAEVMKSFNIADNQSNEVLGLLDKLDKIGAEGVIAALQERGYQSAQVLVESMVDVEKSRAISEKAAARVQYLEEVIAGAQRQCADSVVFQITPAVVRGISYYTGIVFEGVLPECSGVGTVVSGGRYDTLVGGMPGRPIPCVGGSFGIDRLMAAVAQEIPVTAQCDMALIAQPVAEEAVQSLASALRRGGLNVVVLQQGSSLGNALSLAATQARFGLVVGEREITEARYTVKNLETREEYQGDVSAISEHVLAARP